MAKLESRLLRSVCATSILPLLLITTVGIARAQTLPFPQIPLTESRCPWNGATASAADYCFDGTRTNTAPVITVASTSSTTSTVTHVEEVTFSGNLAIGGMPVSGSTVGSFSPLSLARVNLATNYTGTSSFEVENRVLASTVTTLSSPLGIFKEYDVHSTEINSINVATTGYYADTTTGKRYYLSIYTPTPSDITENSVQFTGKIVNSDGENGPIVFGKIGGTATLLEAAGQSLVTPDGYSGITSPYALKYDFSPPVILTSLDENGLIAPRVSVTQGIEMNGSKITGLAAGTVATDAVNKAQLDGEAQARIASDLKLTTDLATEASTRALADSALNQRILNEEGARQQLAVDLQSEANARAAADLSLGTQLGALGGRIDALGSRVTAVENRVGALEGRVDRLDRKIDASTATAVALSGNTFLPDTHFNLTANVATYGSAQAGALQVGAMVSGNVAVNAGVATGFSKGGKTAGRVGFTMGW